MKVVLVSGRTPWAAESLAGLQRLGAELTLVSSTEVGAEVREQVSGVEVVLASWLTSRTLQWRKFRLDTDRLPFAWRMRRSATVQRVLAVNDCVVAYDAAAIPALWWAARRHPHLTVLSGLPALAVRYPQFATLTGPATAGPSAPQSRG